MQINSERIRSERQKRAWSQEQLAQVAGLGVRTVQRVESGGSASFETVKALAAVLELPLENLLAEPAPLPFWRRPLNLVATASLALLVLFTGTLLVPTVLASQVEVSMAVQRNDETISQNRVISEDGQSVDVMIDQLLKITLRPRIQPNATVMIQAEVYTWSNGAFRLSAKPGLLANNGKPVQLKVTTDSGEQLNLSLTPQIR